MKKTLPILLSLLFLFNAGVNTFIYWQLHRYFKSQGLARITKVEEYRDQLEVITVPVSIQEEPGIFEWKDEKKEIKYHGLMYDIVSMEIRNDSLAITCIADHRETHLERIFIAQFEKSDSDTRDHQNPLLLLRHLEIKDGLLTVIHGMIYSIKGEEYQYFNVSHHYFTDSEIPAPPPKLS